MSKQEDIISILDQVRPALQRDGGDVEFVRYDEGTKIVYLRLVGACAGCPMSQMTLKNGIEKYLKQKIPNLVESVESA